jgi:Fe2+ transport system protein B
LTALEVEDHLLLAGASDDGKPIDADQCQRLFSLQANENPSSNGKIAENTRRQLTDLLERQKNQIVEQIKSKNGTYFEIEVDKLDSWADDQRNSLKSVLKEMDEQIKEIKKQARLAPNLPEKLKLEREKQQLEAKRDKAWKDHELAFREIEKRKDALMDDIEKRLNQKITETPLFTIRWRIT